MKRIIAPAVLTALIFGAGSATAGPSPTSNPARDATAVSSDSDSITTNPPDVDFVGEDWTVTFNIVATDVAERFPDDFSEAVINPDKTSGTLSFRGPAPTGALPLIESVGGVSVVENTGYTNIMVQEAAASALHEASASLGVSSGLSSYRDGAAHVITVAIGESEGETQWAGDETPPPVGPDEIADLKERLDEVVPLPPLFDIVVVVSGRVSSTEAVDSGRNLGGCTTSFPVKRTNGPELGIMTAGHCAGTGS